METTDVEILQHVSADVIYQQDKAFIDLQISTAKAFPRNIKRATDNAIAIVTIDEDTAKTCTYSVPRGEKPITGPSINLAKILAQVWGNLRIESKVVAIDATQITSEAVCFDLENNLAIKTQVRRSIQGKRGRFNDDMITVTGNAANAIALRNAILAVIPRAIVDKCYNAAKAKITGDVSDETKLLAKRKLVFDGLRDNFNLSEKQILGAIGKAAINHVTSDDLVVLIGIGTAIRDGDTTIEQAFNTGKESKESAKDSQQAQEAPKETNGNGVTIEALQKLYDEKLPLLSKAEMLNSKRIIGDKEVNSYKKLFNFLTNKNA